MSLSEVKMYNKEDDSLYRTFKNVTDYGFSEGILHILVFDSNRYHFVVDGTWYVETEIIKV